MSTSSTNPPARTLKFCLENSFECLEPSTKIAHNCCICLEDCHDDDYAVKVRNVSGCNHIFGYKCISMWLDTSNTCPMCRVELYRKPRPIPVMYHTLPHWADRYDSGINPRSTGTQDLTSWLDSGFDPAIPRHRLMMNFAGRLRRHALDLDERRLTQRQLRGDPVDAMEDLERARGRLYAQAEYFDEEDAIRRSERARVGSRIVTQYRYYTQMAEALDTSIQQLEEERRELNENINARLDARTHARLLRQERAGGEGEGWRLRLTRWNLRRWAQFRSSLS
jgi:hypothetical protein